MDTGSNEEVNWLQEETCEFDMPEGVLSPSSPGATSTLIQEDDDDDCEVFFGPVTDVEIQRHVEVIKKEPLEPDKLSSDQLTMLEKESKAVSLMLQSNKKIEIRKEYLRDSQENEIEIKNCLLLEEEKLLDSKQETSIPIKNDVVKKRGIPVMAQQKRTLKMPTPRIDKQQSEFQQRSQIQQPSSSLIRNQSNSRQLKPVTSVNRPKNNNIVKEDKKPAISGLPKLASRIAIPSTSRLPKANSGLIVPRKTSSSGCSESTPRLVKSTSEKIIPRRSIITSLRDSLTENNTKKSPDPNDSTKSLSPNENRTSLLESFEEEKLEESCQPNTSPEQKTAEAKHQDCEDTSNIMQDLLITDISVSSEADINKIPSPLKESKPTTNQITTTENQIKEECLISLPVKNKENIPHHLIDSPLLKFSPLKQTTSSRHDPFSTGTTPPSLIVLSPELKPQPMKISNLIEF